VLLSQVLLNAPALLIALVESSALPPLSTMTIPVGFWLASDVPLAVALVWSPARTVLLKYTGAAGKNGKDLACK
jgi:hypothetical protein